MDYTKNAQHATCIHHPYPLPVAAGLNPILQSNAGRVVSPSAHTPWTHLLKNVERDAFQNLCSRVIRNMPPPSHFGISILGCSPSHQQAGLYPLCPWERKTKKFPFPMWEFSNNFFYMGMTTGNSFWWGKSKLLQTWRLCFAFQYECYAGKQWRFPYKSPLGSGDKLIRLGDEETLKQEKGATQNKISIQAPDCHSQTQKNAYSLHPRHKLYTKKTKPTCRNHSLSENCLQNYLDFLRQGNSFDNHFDFLQAIFVDILRA